MSDRDFLTARRLVSGPRSTPEAAIVPAPAKLNLLLHVTGRLPDGYHAIESVFTLIDLADQIRLTRDPSGSGVRRIGDLCCDPDEDLCVKALKALCEYTGEPLSATIEARKRIPAGSGLGGGSSDAASVLIAANWLFGLELTGDELSQIGQKLGADVPFFIFGRSAWARGKGELLSPIDVPDSWYALVTPPEPTSTARVYASRLLKRDSAPMDLAKLADSLRADWPRLPGRNDLTAAAREINPGISDALAALGPRARMSGSGSSVFRVCPSARSARYWLSRRPVGAACWIARGLSAHPLSQWLKSTPKDRGVAKW